MAERLFFKSSIGELEQMFAANPDDKKLAKNLLAELKHRKTPRAKALKKTIEDYKPDSPVLDTVIKNAVDKNGGNVTIISGFGAMKFAPDGVGELFPVPIKTNYPGTLLRLELKTDTITQEDAHEEDMSW